MISSSHLNERMSVPDEHAITLTGTVGNFAICHPLHSQHQVCNFLCTQTVI